ncbi:hypothetical protein [Pseudodesulfovibrio sp.]|uniref:hypothetical protein n=1 Tax=Pseudodesulfovibrio sp. TaxID=2035812 RepID=UPI0026338F09|nr:hypothetical protein [Pseudodesulfovibrio sp.]MDD3311792.1 hypothetical protein [Pseudodesulfovibrio sp.]
MYGRRLKREMPGWLEFFYRLFYMLFDRLSEIPIPRDAGDFSLVDRVVVQHILECRERDSFLRGLRAYVGFQQVGVDYVRPERLFGRSTNSLIRNLGWAKKAIFSFSKMPLHLLTAFGGMAFVFSCLTMLFCIVAKVVAPESSPQGTTFISLLVMFFGSASVLGLGILGEYLGKVLEETKARPPFIRRHLIMDGETRSEGASSARKETWP